MPLPETMEQARENERKAEQERAYQTWKRREDRENEYMRTHGLDDRIRKERTR